LTEAVAVILAAGAGERLGAATPKAFVPIAGTTVLALATGAAERCPEVDAIVVVVPPGWERRAESLLPSPLAHVIVRGGASRQESVRIALDSIPSGGADLVACHDAARPFASSALFSTVLAAVSGADGAVPVIPVPDTVKRVRGRRVVGTEPREALGLAQTPQAFVLEVLREAHAKAFEDGVEATDDAALLERMGRVVRAVPGEPANFKVTTHEDLIRAEAILTADRSSRLHPPPARSSEGSVRESRGTA
jgi:2-C-methyl-D-erythritol 4-phosphate cytidylyltransferase